MKKILLGLLLSTTSWALSSADSVVTGKYVEGRNPDFINFVKNSSCFRNAYNITGTNTTVSKNTTTPLTSISDCQATLDSSSDTVDFSTNTLDSFLKNGNCEASIKYKLTVGSGNTIQLQARINSATVAAVELTTATNGTATVNFPCGDLTNNPSIRIAQTAGSTSQAINVSNVYLGAPRNIGTVAQAQFLGSLNYAATTNCEWQTTSTTITSFSADTDCPTPTVTGSAVAPGTKVPSVTFNNLPAGNYMVTANVVLGRRTNGVGTCAFRLYDGTTDVAGGPVFNGSSVQINQVATLSGVFSYTSNQSSKTFEIRALSESGTTCALSADGTTYMTPGLTFNVVKLPSTSDVVYNPATAFKGGSVKYTGAASCQWSVATSSFSNFSADTDCNTGTATGDVTAPGTKIPGLVVGTLPAGRYLVVATGAFNKNSGADYEPLFRFSDGTNSTAAQRMYVDGSQSLSVPVLSGILETSSIQSSVTVQVQARDLTASNTVSIINTANTDFQISIIPLSINLPVPILVGSVTSNSTGAERIERAYITFPGGTPTLQSQSGSWVSSLTDNSTGNVSFNLASGIFSAAPTCMCTTEDNGSVGTMCNSVSRSSWTSTFVRFTTTAQTGGSTDPVAMQIVCQGPR